MTFRQLQAFVHVMRLGTIVATAEAMGLTQSGVSRMISELERTVGFKLFVRSGRGLKPTPEGLRFFKEVDRSITEMEALGRVAEEIRLGFGQRLRISCLPTMSATVLPLALKSFHDDFPNTAVEVDTATYELGADRAGGGSHRPRRDLSYSRHGRDRHRVAGRGGLRVRGPERPSAHASGARAGGGLEG
ncbi:MAG: LysR family transcriptional regulator [Roseovarius sp.]|nr:LysR family transcriptional regulator [Roseovarius sp.]